MPPHPLNCRDFAHEDNQNPMKRLSVSLLLLALAGCEQRDQGASSQANAFDVPPLPDFSTIQDVKEKKQAFFAYLLPLVQEANSRILAERALAEKWLLEPDNLSTAEQQELQHLLEKYRITTEDPEQQQDLLLRRVNAIPPSLVLAQAANESAWGTSRFAREGNNLFGQWCFSEGCGLIPEGRGDGARHEVRAFANPLKSIESYMRNLNSHPSYRELRELRQQELEQQGYPSGITLSQGLQNYSERGQDYIDEIQQMIEFNQLQRFDVTSPGGDNQRDSDSASGE